MRRSEGIVIPGRAEGAGPESRCVFGGCFWIPGSLAARAPRNDEQRAGSQRGLRRAPQGL